MKLKKRKLKFAGIFGVCWFAVLVGLVDGVLGFERVKGWCGSWAVAEVALWLAVLVPTVAVYLVVREKKEEFDQETEKNA
jgi:hypothetical protein